MGFISIKGFLLFYCEVGNHPEGTKWTCDDTKNVYTNVNGKVGSQGAPCLGTVLETARSVHEAVLR